MATVNFTIGTIFKGEGFKKCQQGIKNLNGNIKQAAGITAQMAGAMSMMDSKAGKAAAAVSGLMSAFASGNPILIGVQVAMLAVSKVVGELKAAEEEATKAQDKLNESLKRLYETQQRIREEKLNEHLKDITSEAKRLGDEFDRITKKANAMTDILNKIDASKDTGKILQMKIDAMNRQETGNMDDMGVIKAQDELKIQLEKNAIALKRRQEILEKANRDIQENFEREKNIRERVQVLNSGIADLREEENKLSTADLEGRKRIQEKIAKLEEERSALIQQFKDAQGKEILLQEAKLKAEEDINNQLLENQIAEKNANKAVIDAENERADAIRKRNEEEAELRDKQREAETKIIKELEKQLSDAEKKSKEANTNFDKAVGDYRDARMKFGSDNMNLINQMLNNMDRSARGNLRNSGNLQNGMVSLPDENGKPRMMKYQDAAAEMAVERGLKDGSIRNMRDMANTRKAAARAARDAASSNEALQDSRDARELARLEKMNPKVRSARDKQRLKDLNKLKDTKDQAAKDADAKLKAAQDAEEARKKADEAVVQIKEMLEDKLGLK